MIRLAFILSLISTPIVAAPCHEKKMLESYLKVEHGLRLHSWGLNDKGNMLELWLNENGHWAVVTTSPSQCSSVEFPHNLRGRLWKPPSPNKAIPEAERLTPGDPM